MAVMLTVTMAVLDGSIVNVALPSLAADLAVSPAHAIGVVTAYQIAVVAALLPLAALAEAVGFRKVYLSGVVLFAGASLLCAEARSLEVLVLARVVQGLGAAAIMSINSAVVRHIMPRDRLGWGISWVAMTVAVAAAAGPTIAAGILSMGSWHWLFLVNVPVSVLALALGIASLPHTERNGARFDAVSALLNVLAFGCLISALDGVSSGSAPALVAVQLAVAITSAVLLVLRQSPRLSPLLPIDLLRRPPFALALLASVLAFTGQFVAAVSLPFYFHDTLGYSAVQTGLMLTAWPLATGLAAPLAGRLVDRTSARPLTTLGMTVFGTGLILTAAVPARSGPVPMLGALLLTGAGFGMFQSPNNHALLTTAPRERSGAASGLQSTARQLGQSLGAALAALLVGSSVRFEVRPALWTAACFAILAAAVCAVRGIQWRTAPGGEQDHGRTLPPLASRLSRCPK